MLLVHTSMRSEKHLLYVEFESNDTHQSTAGYRLQVIQVRIDRVSKILLNLGEMAMFYPREGGATGSALSLRM